MLEISIRNGGYPMTKAYKGQIAIKTGSSTSTVVPVHGEAPNPQTFRTMIESQYSTVFIRWQQSPIEDHG